jgi:uncharacterized membrane protein
MAVFSAWLFDTPEGAERARGILERAEADQLGKVLDSAIVSWPVGAAEPTTSHKREDTWRGAGWGALFGAMFGVLLFVPVVGAAAVGAGAGALMKGLNGLGISAEQIESIRASVVPGTSALFLVGEARDPDRIAERLRGIRAKLLETNLTEAEARAQFEGIERG